MQTLMRKDLCQKHPGDTRELDKPRTDANAHTLTLSYVVTEAWPSLFPQGLLAARMERER